MPANNKKKIANYLKDSDAAKYVEAIETNSKLDELVKTLKNVNDPAAELPGDLAGKDNIVFVFKGPAGPKGEDGKDGVGKDGKTPIKYVDYFTDDEIKQIIDFATPIKGEDYFTDKDKKQLYKEFEKSIDLSKLRGPKGEDGKPGEKGVDGSPDTGLEISNKLNELKGVLDWSVLKNIPVSFGKKEAGTIGKFSRGVSTFKALTDVPQTYVGQANKVVSVKADESGLEFTAAGGGGSSQWTTSGSDIYYDTGAVFIGMSTDDGGALQIKPDATDDIIRGFSNAGTVQFVIQGNGNIISTPLASGGTSPTMSGTTVMVVTDSNGRFGFETKPVGFTTELAQDAVGAMVDASLTYVDATPLLQRAALTGAITASAGSNATSLGSFTKAQLDAAVSDGNVLYVGDITQYTDEMAQDSVGGILTDTATIDFTYNDGAGTITADVKDNSITGAKIAMGSDAQGDILFYNGTDYARLAAGTSGQYLKTQGAGANPVWATGAGYSLDASATQSNIADATTYYFGNNVQTGLSTTADISRFYIPKGGVIKAVYTFWHVAGTLGSTEDNTVAIRINNSTDTTITSTLKLSAVQNVGSNTGLSINVSQGDYFEIKLTSATLATNPTNVRPSVVCYIEEV